MPATLYSVTRKFTGGILEGLSYTGFTTVKFEVGFRCDSPYGGTSPYVITAVEVVEAPTGHVSPDGEVPAYSKVAAAAQSYADRESLRASKQEVR